MHNKFRAGTRPALNLFSALFYAQGLCDLLPHLGVAFVILLAVWHVPEFDIYRKVIGNDVSAHLPILYGFLINGDVKLFSHRSHRRKAGITEDSTLFVRASAHFVSYSELLRYRHIYSLILVKHISIFSFRGHIQDHPVWRRSAIRYCMPSIVMKIDLSRRSGGRRNHIAPLIGHCIDLHVDSHLPHGTIALHIVAEFLFLHVAILTGLSATLCTIC